MQENQRRDHIGWIGTGIMGENMCRRILEAGYPVAVFSRTRAKAEDLIGAGATWCESPREVARRSGIVFTIVGYPEDVREVILGGQGVLQGFADAQTDAQTDGDAPIVVDMTTSRPALAEEIFRTAATQGVAALDAPVSGGDVGARDGTLSIMVGGESAAVERVQSLFEIMGRTISHLGPAGAGQHTKMVNQILVAAGMIGTVEALLYATRADLNLDEVIGAVGGGAAASWAINTLGPRIARGDMEPGFMIRHFVKDLGIALEEARRLEINLPGLAMADRFYRAAVEKDLAGKGTQALASVYADIVR